MKKKMWYCEIQHFTTILFHKKAFFFLFAVLKQQKIIFLYKPLNLWEKYKILWNLRFFAIYFLGSNLAASEKSDNKAGW